MDKFCFALILFLLCQGCNRGEDFSNYTSDQLHKKAQALALPERYDLYLRVYKSRTPANPELASDIVALGETARAYVLHKSATASNAEFDAALAVLSLYKRACTEEEKKNLLSIAAKLAHGERSAEALANHVEIACHTGEPKGWR